MKQKGSIVTLALVFGGAFALVLGSLTTYILMQYRTNQRVAAKEQAFHIAESGLEYYNWYLAHSLEGLSIAEQLDFWENEESIGYPTPYEGDFKDQYGTVIGHFQIEITPPPSGSTDVVVKSTGWTTQFPALKRVLQTRRRKGGWGEYVLIVNHRANLAEGTVINGPVHSNEDLRIDEPISSLATASDSTHPDPDTEEETSDGVWTTEDPEDIFLGGREDGVPLLDFNALTAKFSELKTITEGTDYYLGPPEETCWPSLWFCMVKQWDPSGYIIELNDDSTIDIYETTGLTIMGYYLPHYTSASFKGTYDWPVNRLIFSEATVWVEGEVGDDQITIATANMLGRDLPGPNNMPDIVIQDDILYEHANAKVGLMSQDNVMIDKNFTGNDLEINAAIIAKEGMFGREDFADNLGDLTVNGSIAANYLGELGEDQYCFFAWCWVMGFDDAEVNYDSDLLYNAPPYFPGRENYSTDMWEELE